MAFKVHARTIFHLGADLISSDAIALYELIKNAFDAGSRDVEVKITVRMPEDEYLEQRAELRSALTQSLSDVRTKRELQRWREVAGRLIDRTAPGAKELRAQIESADSLLELCDAMESANYIEIIDSGEGMSKRDLEELYLTIGTPHRKRQKDTLYQKVEDSGPPILGEKGVGRLAVMRLGQRLLVESTRTGEAHWNILDINWDDFALTDADLEDIAVDPKQGSAKTKRAQQGTRIHICALSSVWTKDRLREIARNEFSRLCDPFRKGRYPILVSYNEEAISIPRMDAVLFEHAHAYAEARLIVGPQSRFEGKVEYRLRKSKMAFKVEGPELLSTAGVSSLRAVKSLGSFSVVVYWYNRKLFQTLKGDEFSRIKELQDMWAGGLMVYRDGFRVNPYGTGDDDWLRLDPKAFGSGGYKVNRRQIVGKVDISSKENSKLKDQTNREGLRNSPEKGVLVRLLQHLLWHQLKPFLDECDREHDAPPLTPREIEKRVEEHRLQVARTLKSLANEYPEAKKSEVFLKAKDALEQIGTLVKQVRRQVSAYKHTRDKVIHLAGTGMMVEILAHELSRATRHTLVSLRGLQEHKLDADAMSLLWTLESQLRTLQKRIQILDPLSTAGRQTKEEFDLVSWVGEILRAHKDQFQRHSIECSIKVLPAGSKKELIVKMVRGMIVQVMENLLSNSVYWLKQQRQFEPKFEPRIEVIIDRDTGDITVWDNGPGVPVERQERIFEPYVTTKAAGEGKGLGLFISREIAKYHKATLAMSTDKAFREDRLNAFVLSLKEAMA